MQVHAKNSSSAGDLGELRFRNSLFFANIPKTKVRWSYDEKRRDLVETVVAYVRQTFKLDRRSRFGRHLFRKLAGYKIRHGAMALSRERRHGFCDLSFRIDKKCARRIQK